MALALVTDLLVVADVRARVRVLALVDVARALVGVVAAVVLTVAETLPRDAAAVLAAEQPGTLLVVAVRQERSVVGRDEVNQAVLASELVAVGRVFVGAVGAFRRSVAKLNDRNAGRSVKAPEKVLRAKPVGSVIASFRFIRLVAAIVVLKSNVMTWLDLCREHLGYHVTVILAQITRARL